MTVTALISPDDPTRITLESEYQDRDRIKTLLSVKWAPKTKVWAAPLTWSTCLALRGTFGEDLVIDQSLKDWAANERKMRVDPAVTLREAISLDDLTHLNPATELAHDVAEEIGLFPHQAAGAAFMATTESCGIFDETGTGKSAQAISALRTMHRAGKDVFPVLVVAPNSVKTPWAREFDHWWPGLEIVKLEGSTAQRRKLLESPAHIFIANYEQLHRHSRLAKYGSTALKRCTECGGMDEAITPAKCEVHDRELNQVHFQTVIADEAHRLKAPSAKQTRAAWAIADKAEYRFALTGTPVQDNLDDLWAVLRFISPNEFPAKGKFLDRYAEIGYNTWGVQQIMGLKKGMEDEFYNVISSRMRRMLKKVVTPFLPPLLTEMRMISMSGAQAKAYREMRKHALVELDDDVVTATSPLSKATRLLQFASSFAEMVPVASTAPVPIDESEITDEGLSPDPSDDFASTLRLSLPSNKITAFLEDVRAGDFGESSLVVFAQSRQLIDLLAAEMTKAEYKFGMITGGQSTDERQQAIDDFQAGKINFVLVTIAAGGVGLTLTKADKMIFLQRSFSSTAMVQAYSRAHRIGSEIHENVTIVHYITEGTVEEKQMDILEGKGARIEEILKDKDLLKKFLADED